MCLRKLYASIEKCCLLFFFLLFSAICFAQHSVTIIISNQPSNHSADSLYVAGSFNGWNPGVNFYSFEKNKEGHSSIVLQNIKKGFHEFKITRGSWQTVECAKNGAAISNRIIKVTGDTLINLSIEAWADDIPSRPPVSTRSKNVFIIDTAFYMPQLKRNRRVWIYLPENYSFSKKQYPVLYMHDGQNIFDALTAAYGEWGLDEMMDSIRPGKQCIIVGIDHGGNKRLTEYNPYNSQFGIGEGDAYVDFLTLIVKPYIDKKYRTKADRQNTFIAGSSMGGLISLYAVTKYPAVFGGAGILSPAFWLSSEFAEKLKNTHTPTNASLYFVCGELESNEMVGDMQKVYSILKENGEKKLFIKTVPDGRHQESFWKTEMYDCYMWLRKN
jgi:predicted alpha/beta superfamily hydrolase